MPFVKVSQIVTFGGFYDPRPIYKLLHYNVIKCAENGSTVGTESRQPGLELLKPMDFIVLGPFVCPGHLHISEITLIPIAHHHHHRRL